MALGWRCFSKGADTNYGLLLFAECFLQRVGVTWRKDRSWLTDQLVIRSRLQEGYVGCGATGSTHLIVSLRRLKGDWVEFCDRLAFPSHASSQRPCFLCNATVNDNFCDPSEVSILECPWRPNEEADYDNAADAAEI